MDANIAVAAAESHALCTILLVIDGQDKVEAILDPGCQVVVIFKEVCNMLVLPYDPTVWLHIMSANSSVDQSLGLSHNVPFHVGDITLYLQVHVLHKPTYDILLGQPLDVLICSIVHNYMDENQTITILNPNTGCKAMVPTILHSSFHFTDHHIKKNPAPAQDF